MWREFVTRGFQIAQLEEWISLLINIFAFLKTWRARYLYHLARHVFGFLISLFSIQIWTSDWQGQVIILNFSKIFKSASVINYENIQIFLNIHTKSIIIIEIEWHLNKFFEKILIYNTCDLTFFAIAENQIPWDLALRHMCLFRYQLSWNSTYPVQI